MYFVTIEDFYQKAYKYKILPREEEKSLSLNIQNNPEARQKIVNSYLPMIAKNIERLDNNYQNLELVYRCIQALGQCIDKFNFQQDSETFAHRFSWSLRQTITKYIADIR